MQVLEAVYAVHDVSVHTVRLFNGNNELQLALKYLHVMLLMCYASALSYDLVLLIAWYSLIYFYD